MFTTCWAPGEVICVHSYLNFPVSLFYRQETDLEIKKKKDKNLAQDNRARRIWKSWISNPCLHNSKAKGEQSYKKLLSWGKGGQWQVTTTMGLRCARLAMEIWFSFGCCGVKQAETGFCVPGTHLDTQVDSVFCLLPLLPKV